MLEPRERSLLLESLRPPAGYRLDFAVATTYSLDLLALLTAPLAFTFFDWEDEEGRPTADPLALLEAARRHARKIALFCQAGQIAVPRKAQPLYAYLEDCVFEVALPADEFAFHPKTWLLRYNAANSPVRYRFLCSSRNLTFDRSWDTLLVLDGVLEERRKAYAVNHPLGDFIATLPKLSRPVPESVRKEVTRMAREVRRVRFSLPENADDIAFWPLGIEGHTKWPFRGRIDRMLVVSPFLAEDTLERFSEDGTGEVLVSRVEELSRLRPQPLRRFRRVLTMIAEAMDEPSLEEDEERVPESLAAQHALVPRGLHAKIYVADAGRDASVWIGSANATRAAFAGNVEFLVELIGSKSRLGIEAFLKSGGAEVNFESLLAPLDLGSEPEERDADQEAVDEAVDELRRKVSRLGLTAQVAELEDGSSFAIELARLKARGLALPDDVTVRCWPITLPEMKSVEPQLEDAVIARFNRLSFEALTSFYAFEATATVGRRSSVRRFVINAPLQGAPADRQERILRMLLKDRDHLIRFILLLLAGEGMDEAGDLAGMSAHAFSAFGQSNVSGPALFEALARALHRDPARLDQVASLVADLRRTPEGSALLPDGFDLIWQPIWRVREELRT